MRTPMLVLASLLVMVCVGSAGDVGSVENVPRLEITEPADGEIVPIQSFFSIRLRFDQAVSGNCTFSLFEVVPEVVEPVAGCSAAFVPVEGLGGPDGYKVRFFGGCWSANPPYWEILVPQPEEVIVWKNIRISGGMDLVPGHSYRLTAQCDAPDWLFDEVFVTVSE